MNCSIYRTIHTRKYFTKTIEMPSIHSPNRLYIRPHTIFNVLSLIDIVGTHIASHHYRAGRRRPLISGSPFSHGSMGYSYDVRSRSPLIVFTRDYYVRVILGSRAIDAAYSDRVSKQIDWRMVYLFISIITSYTHKSSLIL